MRVFAFVRSVLLCAAILVGVSGARAAENSGVTVRYKLPETGPLPKTYQVTLAITDPKNPDWIVSTFAAGITRTVTAENHGEFAETWNGLDDNFMPVPPGDYGVKGIFAPAHQWAIDGEWHAITPKFAGGVSPWLPTPDQLRAPVPFGGDPVNSPMRDVAVGPNGVAVFYYQYLENGLNAPLIDLKKPVGPEQFIRAFPSGGAAGGPVATTDGETVWAFSNDGGPRFVFRTDGRPFGKGAGANRRDTYIPDGWVTAMASTRDAAGKPYVFVAQRGKIVATKTQRLSAFNLTYNESLTEFVDRITVHDGVNGDVLTSLPAQHPLGLAIQGGKLFVLHTQDKAWVVSSVPLAEGRPNGELKPVFTVPGNITPADMEVDSHNRFYFSDSAANKVFQLDGAGKLIRTFGRLEAQKPGTYDPETFMSPAKLAVWTDAQGKDRLIVVEMAGPNRVSEWSPEDSSLLREFPSYQTKANNGYAIDPADPTLIYLPGQGDWLTRFKVNYQTREWKVDAVWPNVESGQRKGLDKPVAIRANGQLYLASEQNLTIYRLEGSRWLPSAGLVRKDKDAFLWNDANGDGRTEENELRPTTLPAGVLTYHGQKWLTDLSYLAPGQGTRDVWRLAPERYDAHGNPIFKSWQKVLTDPIFTARANGTVDAIHGGNELVDSFTSDWMQADGSVKDGFYIQARGMNFDANRGAQHKISRYVPDAAGGYTLKWRVGRTALHGAAERGEIIGGMRLFQPINGLLTVVDQSRSGLLLYTSDGMYVDTLFPADGRKDAGMYALPGEFFAGTMYSDPASGKIFYASGKYTPLLYEMEGWSLKQNPVQLLTTVQPKVTIAAAQISPPLEMALSLRGGAGQARVARFMPALGGAELDGSLTGWEAAEPVNFESGKKSVEVRALYDPETLFLRWHVRLGEAFEPKPLPPLERMFMHDQGSDTVSFYLQGDQNAPPKGPAGGRPGDVRFVFGAFRQGDKVQPAGVALYPSWPGKDAKAQIYRTPVGQAAFAHVGAIPGVKLGYAADADNKGFVLAAAIPRSAVPAMKTAFNGEVRTLVNFDANLGGHDKFWWANADGSANRETYDEPSEARLYPGSWAPALFQGIGDGVAVRNWLIAGPFGGPGAEKFVNDPRNKEEVSKFFENAVYPPDDGQVNPKATYSGEIIQGYWRDPGKVSWKPAGIADMDTRVILGGGSQAWYGASWIYAPADTEVQFDLQSHRMTYLRWSLNGQQLNVPQKEYKPGPKPIVPEAARTVTLRAGWNQVSFRGYCVGYAPFRVGLVVQAAPEKLWGLRFSGRVEG